MAQSIGAESVSGAPEACRGARSHVQSGKEQHVLGRKLFKAWKRTTRRGGGANVHCSGRAGNRVRSHQPDSENGHFTGPWALGKFWEQLTPMGHFPRPTLQPKKSRPERVRSWPGNLTAPQNKAPERSQE